MLSQRNRGAAHLSASPADIQCGQRPGAGGLGGILEGALALPSSSGYYLPSLSSCAVYSKVLSGQSRKVAENYLLFPKLCRAKSQSLCSNLRQSSPSRWDPSAPRAPHVAPGAPLLPAGTGRRRRVLGANPPSVRVCACVCVCSGCLAANGAWEARTGG